MSVCLSVFKKVLSRSLKKKKTSSQLSSLSAEQCHSALHCTSVLSRAISDDGIQGRTLLADTAARGNEVCIAPLVREGVGGAPGRYSPPEHVLSPFPLLFSLQSLSMLLDLDKENQEETDLRCMGRLANRSWVEASGAERLDTPMHAQRPPPSRLTGHGGPEGWGLLPPSCR